MANYDLMEKAVKLSEAGFTAEQINKIIDEDIKRMSEDKKPPVGDEEKKPPEGDEEKKPPEGDEEKKPPEDKNEKRVKELEEQLKKAQEKARRTGDEENPEEKEKKAYDTLLSKVKNY